MSVRGRKRGRATQRTWNRPRHQHLVIGMLVVAPILGAAVAAGTHVETGNRFVAEAVVVLVPENGEPSTARRGSITRTEATLFGQLLELNPVLQRVSRRLQLDGSLDEIRARVAAQVDLSAGTMKVIARDRTPERAKALANALSNQAVRLVQQLQVADGRADLVIGDFESGLGDWTGASIFSVAPGREELVKGGARYGERWLRVTCSGRAGCGPAAVVEYPFGAGVRYTASAWLRSPTGSEVALLFGSSSRHIVTTAPIRLSRGWKRVMVEWMPTADVGRAEVSFLSRGAKQSVFGVDGVVISDPRSSPEGRSGATSGAEEAATVRLARGAATVIPAESRGTVDSGTLGWTVGGAVVGLLVALAAVAGASLAGRRRVGGSQRRPWPDYR